MSFNNHGTPTGELDIERVEDQILIDFASVDKVVHTTNVANAWKKVKSNKGAPGVDRVNIERFPKWARPRWISTKKKLLSGTFSPRPALRVEIPKESGGFRKLGIPCVLERVIMQSIAQLFGGIFNQHFSRFSFGYRPGCSVLQAAKEAQTFYREGYRWQIDIDLEKFFDTVNHDVLMNRVARRVKNKGLLKLIGCFLRSGVEVKGRLQATNKGVPQGSPLSPILSNILLDDLDKELEKRGHRFVRYADDLAIFVRSERAGHRVMESITNYLEKKLKVKVNRKKSKVSQVKESAILGFHIHLKKLRATEPKVQKFKAQLKEITRRCPGISIVSRYIKLRKYIQGWMAHYGIGLKYDDAVNLDGWIRRRIRMCYWKQWRQSRKRIRELIKRGVRTKEAISIGLSRKSYWRLSKTLATNCGLSNVKLEREGLISIRTLWCKIHYPATAR